MYTALSGCLTNRTYRVGGVRFYGGDRVRNDLLANTLLALDALTALSKTTHASGDFCLEDLYRGPVG